jgi:hypothetical protein
LDDSIVEAPDYCKGCTAQTNGIKQLWEQKRFTVPEITIAMRIDRLLMLRIASLHQPEA